MILSHLPYIDLVTVSLSLRQPTESIIKVSREICIFFFNNSICSSLLLVTRMLDRSIDSASVEPFNRITIAFRSIEKYLDETMAVFAVIEWVFVQEK